MNFGASVAELVARESLTSKHKLRLMMVGGGRMEEGTAVTPCKSSCKRCEVVTVGSFGVTSVNFIEEREGEECLHCLSVMITAS